MLKTLAQYRLPARLRRRPPLRKEDGVLRVSITPRAMPQQVYVDGSFSSDWSKPVSTMMAYPLRPDASIMADRSDAELDLADQMLDKLDAGDDFRQDKVNEIRRLLASETYENTDQVDRAIDQLLDDLNDESI